MSNFKNLIKRFNEANIEDRNYLKLDGKILFETLPGGIVINMDKDNKDVDISLFLSDKSGNSSYAFEDNVSNKNEFNLLLKDVKLLMSSFDDDFKGILQKHGLFTKD